MKPRRGSDVVPGVGIWVQGASSSLPLKPIELQASKDDDGSTSHGSDEDSDSGSGDGTSELEGLDTPIDDSKYSFNRWTGGFKDRELEHRYHLTYGHSAKHGPPTKSISIFTVVVMTHSLVYNTAALSDSSIGFATSVASLIIVVAFVLRVFHLMPGYSRDPIAYNRNTDNFCLGLYLVFLAVQAVKHHDRIKSIETECGFGSQKAAHITKSSDYPAYCEDVLLRYEGGGFCWYILVGNMLIGYGTLVSVRQFSIYAVSLLAFANWLLTYSAYEDLITWCTMMTVTCFLFIFFSANLDGLRRRSFVQMSVIKRRNASDSIAAEFAHLVDNANAPIFALDTNGTVELWNRKAVEITGFTKCEMIGKPFAKRILANKEDRSIMQSVIREVLSGTESFENLSLTVRTKGGGTRLFLFNVTARHKHNNSEVTGTISVAQDVTDVMRIKEQAVTNHERAEAEREMNEYLSHEVRNPLTVSWNASDLASAKLDALLLKLAKFKDLLSDPPGKDEDDSSRHAKGHDDVQDQPLSIDRDAVCSCFDAIDSVRSDLAIVQSNVDFTLNLLSDMMDINKLISGVMKPKSTPIDVDRDIFQNIRPMIMLKPGVELRTECAYDDPLITYADLLRVQQVIVNLVHNAMKYTDEGFVLLRASLDVSSPDLPAQLGRKRVDSSNGTTIMPSSVSGEAPRMPGNARTPTTVTSSPMVSIEVMDTGPGIPADKSARLFSKYQTLNEGKVQGSGLGLHLCWLLCNTMGGSLEHVPGRRPESWTKTPGCCMRVVLPTVAAVNLKKSAPTSKLGNNAEPASLNDDWAATNERLGVGDSDDKSHPLEVKEGGTWGTSSSIAGHTRSHSNSSIKPLDAPAPATAVPPRRMKKLLHKELRALVVDDNAQLGKVLKRQLERVSVQGPWEVEWARTGESAIQLVSERGINAFQLVIMDQYMSEGGGDLLGDKVIVELRRMGFEGIVIGSSGNDMKQRHLDAGADFSWRKPINFSRGLLLYPLHSRLTLRFGLPRDWSVTVFRGGAGASSSEQPSSSFSSPPLENVPEIQAQVQEMGEWARAWEFQVVTLDARSAVKSIVGDGHAKEGRAGSGALAEGAANTVDPAARFRVLIFCYDGMQPWEDTMLLDNISAQVNDPHASGRPAIVVLSLSQVPSETERKSWPDSQEEAREGHWLRGGGSDISVAWTPACSIEDRIISLAWSWAERTGLVVDTLTSSS